LRVHARLWIAALIAVAVPIAATAVSGTVAGAFPTPIQHVVILLQENHSFDNVLSRLCIEDHRDCNTATRGTGAHGGRVAITRASDLVPDVAHSQRAQLAAIDHGAMDGWNTVPGCARDQCYTAYEPSQIPSLARLARAGAISDAFYSRDIVPSWGGHIDLFAQTLDGFVGDNPERRDTSVARGPGWGCDSNRDALWRDSTKANWVWEPSCIPDANGFGPYRSSPVKYVPTIADRLDAAQRSWGIYGATGTGAGYEWSICPSFAECLYSSQRNHVHSSTQLLADAGAGTLPNLSIVVPNGASGTTSQHNGTSMMAGDNWIGRAVSAIQSGPNGPTTTIFVYYDDCGCFYDHQRPPSGLGIRLPLAIISPYAKPGYTDHVTATNSSILAYAEHVLAVDPINALDRDAYDLSHSFDYNQTPTAPFQFHPTPVPQASLDYLRTHPPAADDT
jgi:phospholipase C